MVRFLPGQLVGVIAFSLWWFNTIVCCILLYLVTAFKLLAFTVSLKRVVSRLAEKVAELWVTNNCLLTDFTQNIQWEIHSEARLDPKTSYLIICNHQSWVDIIALQRVFNHKVPFMRFFIKKQLFWVPFLGLAWWALDFPFMSRYSKEYLEKFPEKKGKDLEETKRRCERFKYTPTSIFIFPEGTRFTPEKHQKRNSPYPHLLPPKAGGLSAVLDVMGTQFKSMIDVTIAYPQGRQNFWAMFSGKINHIKVQYREISIPEALKTSSDTRYFERKLWLEKIWDEKNKALAAMLSS